MTPSVSPQRSLFPPLPTATAAGSRVPSWFIAISLALAFMPVLTFMASRLWQKEHYQFFPLIVLVVVALGCTRLPRVRPLVPGEAGPRRALAVVSFILLAAATAMFSPLLGYIAALTCSLGVTYALGGRELLKAWLPLFALLCLLIPLPGQLDQSLILGLQDLVVNLASRVLDELGIMHLRSGNVLVVPGKRLMVDEACSGINGLQSGLAVVLTYCVVMRRPLPVTLTLIPLTIMWVIIVNVARVTVIGWADVKMGVDLSQGWQHTVLGVCTFASVILLVLSSEQLLFFGNARWAAPATEPAVATVESPSSTAPIESVGWLSSYVCLGAFALLGVAHLAEWGYHWSRAPRIAPQAGAAPTLGMPSEFAGWQRLDGQPFRHSTAQGVESQAWAFRKGDLVVVVSLDSPHRGCHYLELCYTGDGWTVDRIDRTDNSGGAAIPRSELTMHQASRRNGVVLYSHLGEDGNWISAIADVDFVNPTTRGDLQARFFRRSHGRIFEPVSYQMQMFVERPSPLTTSELDDARKLFAEVQRYWQQQLVQSQRVLAP